MNPEMLMLIIQFGLLGLIIYFFMIRPESKRRKAVTSMQNSLERGDRVVTIGGIHGRIHLIEEGTITLINDEGAKWTFERSAISRKLD